MTWRGVWLLTVVALIAWATVDRSVVFADVAAPPATIVVEIGGVGTDDAPGWPWNRVEHYLGDGVGFRPYQYATCSDIDANVRQLVSYVQSLAPARVVLAGHSMGGVLALSAVGDLSDMVQAVVIVDAPLNGLNPKLVYFGESIGLVPPCLALQQMEDPSWAQASAGAVRRALANGVKVLNVTNAYDNMVPLAAQQLPQQVNVRFDVTNGSGLINHTAVFGSTAALSAMAQFILAQ